MRDEDAPTLPAIPDNEDCALPLKQGAAYYGKDSKTYLKLAEQGKVPRPYKIGERLHLSRNAIRRDLAERARQAEQELEAQAPPPPPPPVTQANGTVPPPIKRKPGRPKKNPDLESQFRGLDR